MFYVPGNEVCNVMIKIDLSIKFGAVFNQFSNTVEESDKIILEEFKMDASNLRYDMFLNATCVVIFLGSIDIYQINISSRKTEYFCNGRRLPCKFLVKLFLWQSTKQ